MEKLISWYCGQMKAVPYIVHNRVIDYRYAPVNGCGELNRPGTERCWRCGKERERHSENSSSVQSSELEPESESSQQAGEKPAAS